MTEKTRFIELRLRGITQLFNSMDPSPFHEKDLDHDAEEFIVSWAQEYPSKAPLALRIYLDQGAENKETADLVCQAIQHYFNYRAQLSQREFRQMMRKAEKSLLIGIVFLAACLAAAGLLDSGAGPARNYFFKESLTIVGWVAMWRPIEMYLYDWWPVARQIRTYKKLSVIPVEVAKNPYGTAPQAKFQ
ncbi:MAG TPA: hypothetical protein VL688_06865 [Verrucomicrobiae bacterium]|jgi:hypothetical protein|nr:hypothetical protein [Verrucomicrobiae bacterium]